MSNLIDQNTELRKQLNDKNEQYYNDFLLYVRSRSFSKNEQQTEIMLINILQDILEAQQNGVSAQEYFGNEPKQIADELIKEIPNDWKNVVKLLFIILSNYLLVVLISNGVTSLIRQEPFQFDLGQNLIGSLMSMFSVWSILRIVGDTSYVQYKGNWQKFMPRIFVAFLFIANITALIFIHTTLIITLPKIVATVVIILLYITSKILVKKEKYQN